MHPMPTAAIVWNGNGNRAAVVEQKVATRRLCRTYRMPTAVVGFCVPPDPSKVRKICYLEQIINDIFECSLVWNKDAGVIMVVLKAQPRYFNKPWSVNICNFHDKINLLFPKLLRRCRSLQHYPLVRSHSRRHREQNLT